MIPGSGGLINGRWSPDGRFVVAMSVDQSAIQLLDLTTHRWAQITRGAAISTPVWSADSVLYFRIFWRRENLFTASNLAAVHRNVPTASKIFCRQVLCAALLGDLLRMVPYSSRSTAGAAIFTPSPSIFPSGQTTLNVRIHRAAPSSSAGLSRFTAPRERSTR